MTNEQQRNMLECAAKACGVHLLWHERWGCFYDYNKRHESKDFQEWNPLTNSADTASMCAKLDISTHIYKLSATVECFTDNNGSLAHSVIKHDGTPEGKEAAWRLAASMVAAKVGGYEE